MPDKTLGKIAGATTFLAAAALSPPAPSPLSPSPRVRPLSGPTHLPRALPAARRPSLKTKNLGGKNLDKGAGTVIFSATRRSARRAGGGGRLEGRQTDLDGTMALASDEPMARYFSGTRGLAHAQG